MKLRQAFLMLSLLLIGMLAVIGGVTFGALSAFREANAVAQHRQSSMALMNEVREEVEMLGRLVSAYVSTANPRYLIYYYDMLAIREGHKPRAAGLPAAYWDQVIAGVRPYAPPESGELLPLATRAGRLGFDTAEQRVVARILELAEQMKEVEQIAFAATQGLYDPTTREFVSEIAPRRDYAATLLHGPDYLKLRAALVGAVADLERLVDERTQHEVDYATERLQDLIKLALALLVAVTVVLLFGYRFLTLRLLAPLLALHQTASALGQKFYGRRVGAIHGFAEVEQLALTMDGMAAAIEADIEQREVVQRELDQARARAEVAADAKATFLATMSHEIRTPMNAILGMAYLALKSGLQPVQRNYVSKIHAAALSLLGILNDILDFSKIEAGKVVLESEPFDLESVVSNAIFMVQQRAQDKQLELILDLRLSRQGAALVGDSLRLGQVLINLLSNAVKFTERGHVRLCVGELENDGRSVLLRFSVEDTGIGISPEQQVRLFQEFSQADGSTTRKYGGSGLGLSISKRLVEAMGGEIRVRSEIDQGSCFEFSLHLPIRAQGESERCTIRRRRALVVDDYAGSRESMAGMLQLLGCPVVEQASGGWQAVELLVEARERGRPYDLLLLDWRMPGLSGGGVVEEMHLRRQPMPDKTIIVSALDSALLRQQLDKLGVVDAMQKPVFPEVLCRLINSEPGENAGSASPSPSEQQSLAGMRVLVVEDNEINQQVAVEILKEWQIEVDLAVDGEQALATLFSHSPEYYDAVLMDLEMPLLSGTDATRRLRADPRYAKLPVLAMTAHAMGEELQEALLAGINGHVPKPFQPDRLFEVLAQYHRGHGAVTAGFAAAPERALPALEAPDEALLGHLASVPGLNLESLLVHFPGKGDFVRRTLRRFAGEQANLVADLRLQLASHDRAVARRRVHSLKGLSGNLGMTDLQASLAGLEEALKQPGENVEACLASLETVLVPLLAALARLPNEAVAPRQGGGDRGETLRLLRRLRHYLVERDGEAEDLWQANRPLFAGYFSPVEYQRLDWAIAAWEFDAALRVLDGTGQAKGEADD